MWILVEGRIDSYKNFLDESVQTRFRSAKDFASIVPFLNQLHFYEIKSALPTTDCDDHQSSAHCGGQALRKYSAVNLFFSKQLYSAASRRAKNRELFENFL